MIIPIESIFVTSSYVNTPPTPRLPVKVPVAPLILPEKVVAVMMPLAVPNLILFPTLRSPDGTKGPLKLDAVTIPDKFKLPFESPIILSVALVIAL